MRARRRRARPFRRPTSESSERIGTSIVSRSPSAMRPPSASPTRTRWSPMFTFATSRVAVPSRLGDGYLKRLDLPVEAVLEQVVAQQLEVARDAALAPSRPSIRATPSPRPPRCRCWRRCRESACREAARQSPPSGRGRRRPPRAGRARAIRGRRFRARPPRRRSRRSSARRPRRRRRRACGASRVRKKRSRGHALRYPRWLKTSFASVRGRLRRVSELT